MTSLLPELFLGKHLYKTKFPLILCHLATLLRSNQFFTYMLCFHPFKLLIVTSVMVYLVVVGFCGEDVLVVVSLGSGLDYIKATNHPWCNSSRSLARPGVAWTLQLKLLVFRQISAKDPTISATSDGCAAIWMNNSYCSYKILSTIQYNKVNLSCSVRFSHPLFGVACSLSVSITAACRLTCCVSCILQTVTMKQL